MIVKPISRIIQELDATSFTLVGCPGSDGLGTEALRVFAQGLTGAEGDFIVVLGDVSPLGRDPFYRDIADFIDRTATKPVYVMRGNHDGPDFTEYFGPADCAVLSENFVLVMLDNSHRRFSDDTLSFLRDTLAIADSPNIVVAFHLPPPNRVSGDSLTQEEWSRFEEALGVWRNRISLFVCGHAHSYYEDDIDGLRLIVTGGGGARIPEMDRVVSPPHHAVEYRVGPDGVATTTLRPLVAAAEVNRGPEVDASLEEVFAFQCQGHVCHHLDADDAARSGLPNLARLHRAAAESCLQQARGLKRILGQTGDPAAAVAASLKAARGENAEARAAAATAADTAQDLLAAKALRDIMRTGRVFEALYEKASAEMAGRGDIAASQYFVCHSCGHPFAGLGHPNYCAQCGAPADRIHETGN